jgi:DNA-binding winged helix-turn-helix (wHTH) protein
MTTAQMIQVAIVDPRGELDAFVHELTKINPNIALLSADSESGDLVFPTGTDVAVIGSADAYGAGLSEAIALARDAAIPAVALMPAIDLLDVDLSAGAVEVCFPPHTSEDIEARIRAVRRRAGKEGSPNQITVDALSIDQEKYEVRVAGRRIDLTYKEYELLKVLAASPGRVFSRESLLRTVWDYDYFGGTRTVDVHIRRLRAKTDDATHRFIETVRNVGYRFRAPGSA